MKIVLIITILIGLASCTNKKQPDEQNAWLSSFTTKNVIRRIKGDKQLTPFKMKDHKGNIFDSKELDGKVVLLNFFATWCPPCIAELPEFEKYVKEFDKDKFRVIAVDAKESVGKVASFMKRYNYSFTALIDPQGELFLEYGINSLPATIIIDKKGILRYVIPGVRAWHTPEFRKFFKILIEQ